MATPHNVGGILASVAFGRTFLSRVLLRNSTSEARDRMVMDLFERLEVDAYLTRSASPTGMFRASLGDASVPVTLARELEVCRQYLRIEEQRLGSRVSTEFVLDGLPEDAILPGLTLQPLAENAVYHGIEPSEQGGFIAIGGELADRQIRLRIANSLPNSDARSARETNKMAQDNVEQRLRAFFGAEAALEVTSNDAKYTVELRFPYLTERP